MAEWYNARFWQIFAKHDSNCTLCTLSITRVAVHLISLYWLEYYHEHGNNSRSFSGDLSWYVNLQYKTVNRESSLKKFPAFISLNSNKMQIKNLYFYKQCYRWYFLFVGSFVKSIIILISLHAAIYFHNLNNFTSRNKEKKRGKYV